MRRLNGVYTQRFHDVHGRCGHMFQGRFKPIIFQRETYLDEVARYIRLNPHCSTSEGGKSQDLVPFARSRRATPVPS